MAATSTTASARHPTVRRRAASPKKWAIIAGLAVVVLLVAVIALQPWWRKYKAQRDVRELVLGLEAYAAVFGKLPTGSTAQICAALRGTSPENRVVENYQQNSAGEFLDPWGTPYRISTDNGARAFSCGPNRQDEHGTGDDLVSWGK